MAAPAQVTKGALAIGAILAGVLLGGSWTSSWDQALAASLHDARGHPLGGPVLAEVSRDVTALGSAVVLALVTAAAALGLSLSRRTGDALRLLAVVLTGWPVPFALKLAWARPRLRARVASPWWS